MGVRRGGGGGVWSIENRDVEWPVRRQEEKGTVGLLLN